jgi:hypothetical protein
MSRFALTVGLVATLSIATAWAQDDDPNAPLDEKSPAENVTAAALQARAPSNWIDAARARHTELITARVNGPRFGNSTQDEQDENAAASDSSSSEGSTFSDLITQLTGSSALGSLANLITGATGLDTSTTASTESTDTSASIDLSNIPADALAMIEAAGIDINELFSKDRDDDASDATTELSSKDAAGRSQTQDESKFHARLVDSLLSTFFTALSVGFQTTEFIDSLKDFLRPIFTASTTTDTESQDSTSQDGGTTSDGQDGTSDGDGIEDLNPSESESDDSGSIVRLVRPALGGLNMARIA